MIKKRLAKKSNLFYNVEKLKPMEKKNEKEDALDSIKVALALL